MSDSNRSLLHRRTNVSAAVSLFVVVAVLMSAASVSADGGWSWPGDWNIPPPTNRCPARPARSDPCTFVATDATSWKTAVGQICQPCSSRGWTTLYVPDGSDVIIPPLVLLLSPVMKRPCACVPLRAASVYVYAQRRCESANRDLMQ
jgi:hypothetical protein